MKKMMTMVCAVLMLTGILAGCGSSGSAGSGDKTVDLTTFYTEQSEKNEWGDSMIDLTDDLLDSFYAGLKDISVKQSIIKMPMMSSVVNEIALVECENAEDAAKVAEIFQKRVDDQANGGAWYPESMEAWSKAQVITQGNYVAMIASAEKQDEIVADFNALFA